MRAGAMRPRVAGERLTSKQRVALLALHRSSLGSLTTEQLHAAIGFYAANVVTSLEDRDLIVSSPALELGVEDVGNWSLTARGAAAARELEPSPVLCCPTCGQRLPRDDE